MGMSGNKVSSRIITETSYRDACYQNNVQLILITFVRKKILL